MPIQAYINEIQSKYDGGDAREHTYRPALETLMKAIMPDVTAFNDPARIQIGDDEQGQLDFILRKNNIDMTCPPMMVPVVELVSGHVYLPHCSDQIL